MSFLFNTTNLSEPTEEELKVLLAIVMQNGLMIQQLQLMVAIKQKEIEEEKTREEGRRQKENEAEEEEMKQNELRKEKVRMMREWSKKES